MATSAPMLQNTKFEELCRLCGSKTDMLAVHIFEDEGTFSELGKKIYNCLQLQIHQQDELPKLLCDNCLVKLEMFWDFKDRCYRTEQLLVELYKQLKNSSEQQQQQQQQCVPLDTLDSNDMMLHVPTHQILPDDLPTDIDISQLSRRDNSNSPDYAIILPHENHQLENLQLANHDLPTGQYLTNQGNLVILPSRQDVARFNEDNLHLIQQQMLPQEQFKLHHSLQIAMANNENIYAETLKLEPKDVFTKSSQEDADYSSQKTSLTVNSNNMSENSLEGVEGDSQFDEIITHSMDNNDSNLNNINSSNELVKDECFLNEEPRGDLVSLFSTLSRKCQNSLFKYNGDLLFEEKKQEIVAYNKSDGALNCGEVSYKNEESNSEKEVHNEISIDKPIKPAIKNTNGKVCPVCGKIYKSNYKLAEHMTKHTGERPYKCGSCDKAFRSKIGLAQHEAKHTGQYELSCPTCGKGFQCKSYLMVHQRVHSDLKPYPCNTCGIHFKTKQSLLDHTNRHLGVKPFSCSICNRGFITKSLCAAHERTHAGIDNRKYSCKICEKLFVSKSYLQTHSRIHTGEKSFICEVCGKGFLTRVDLKIHLTMHTGEKSYVCEMCGKAFARRDALKCHRRMHTGERPYRCDVCGRTFTQFTPMANHRRHHTGEKPFTCNTCGKTFVSKSTMVSHQKKHKTESRNHTSDDCVKNEISIEEHSL